MIGPVRRTLTLIVLSILLPILQINTLALS